MLGVKVAKVGPWTVLHVAGELDMATCPQLRQELVASIGDGAAQIVVDLSSVAFIDSTGLGVLIGALKRARAQGGDLKVAGLTPRIAEIFTLTGLGEVLAVVDLDDPSWAQAAP